MDVIVMFSKTIEHQCFHFISNQTRMSFKSRFDTSFCILKFFTLIFQSNLLLFQSKHCWDMSFLFGRFIPITL